MKDCRAEEFRYQVKFYYNGHHYENELLSQKNLEAQLAEESPRFIIDTVEGSVSAWIDSEGLLVKGEKLQNVCLYHENGTFIANISNLPYQ